MTLVRLSDGYAYDDIMGCQKIIYKLSLIPFLDLPKPLQEKLNKIEDEE